MKDFALHAKHILLPNGVVEGWLRIIDGCFAAVTRDKPEGIETNDVGDGWIAPGFVDTHIHGFANCDVMDCDPDALDTISKAIAKHGTTSWLPTTLTASPEDTQRACKAVATAYSRRSSHFEGARIQGIFLEGPFFSEKYKGAQNPVYLRDPSIELLERWQEAAQGLIKKSALAPERAGACEYIRACTNKGIVAAVGHSDASCNEARAAVDAGATVFVHTYNAMRPLTHRDPGVVGCAMTDDRAFSEIICDGLHVDPVAVEALVRAKTWDHVMLVSDSLRCGGMPDGEYLLGELPIRLKDGVARLVDGNNIAGSVLTLDKAVKNVVAWGIASAEEALRMATQVPAQAHGLDTMCGIIREHAQADFVVLNSSLELMSTYIGGEKLTI